ncbi:hypothetical protein [Xenorhabdus innexi]|nr:hypothetical protein [Xenorhabdus innexi]
MGNALTPDQRQIQALEKPVRRLESAAVNAGMRFAKPSIGG